MKTRKPAIQDELLSQSGSLSGKPKSLEQLAKDLEGLERLQSMQLQLVREIRKQIATMHNTQGN